MKYDNIYIFGPKARTDLQEVAAEHELDAPKRMVVVAENPRDRLHLNTTLPQYSLLIASTSCIVNNSSTATFKRYIKILLI
jgi:hypothetical protein